MSIRIFALTIITFATAASFALAPNQVLVHLNGGLSGNVPNYPTVSVTICDPGTDKCQHIDNILVDTASVGLRLFKSRAFNLHLPAVTDENGNQVYECRAFDEGTEWGSIRYADVHLGGEVARNLRIQVQENIRLGAYYCRGGKELSVENTSLNGVLGLGPDKTDEADYYICRNSRCLGTNTIYLSPHTAVTNPVYDFIVDNNGFSIELPEISAPTVAANGILTFGVNTQRDNYLKTSAQRFLVQSGGFFPARYNGKTFQALLDSGDQHFELPQSSNIAECKFKKGYWHCPQKKTEFFVEAGPSFSSKIEISLNPLPAFKVGQFSAIPSLVDSFPSASQIVLGLPFFFGKRIVLGFSADHGAMGDAEFISFLKSNPADFTGITTVEGD